ncbi:putative Dihydroflavonol 4-reductase [Frankia canadensis]|uniref:Putative Dihydroflavonol 4-reductase n=1 Tax=Frankia canadensis TaxID=1836972 RepID=A0A2I2KLJ8_9ACTN|nr:NAD-dependent epimerase/dehydratase family protein [Frankia canadensis]SNQ46542.1 putative Dihydroflavonol 4-reductase [Frankia canadensis]SOU53832.1 putative Dihydroflavonol 4-reductase [Frankia canadensis]
MRLFITGGSGLTGANLCVTALQRGHTVTTMVRDPASASFLTDAGCRVVTGDLANLDALADGMTGADAVINSAAVIGGTWSTAGPDDYDRANYQGVVNVLDVAERAASHPRCVMISTAAILDMSHTMTEISPLQPIVHGPTTYTPAKLSAYYLTMHRASRGLHACTVVPSGIYGPSPLVDRALAATSFNSSLLGALRGEFDGYLDMPLPWVFVQDVADIVLAAAEQGRPGARYLAIGSSDDLRSLPDLCNQINDLAGVAHRVRAIRPQDEPERFGAMTRFSEHTYADPPIDASVTNKELGITSTPVAEGLRRTLDWLRAAGRVPGSGRVPG